MRSVAGRVVLGWVAVVGPVGFTIAWIVAEAVQEGYSPRQDYLSELAALDAQHVWIMITGFLLFGAGAAALGVGLAGATTGRPARIGSTLVVIGGLGIIVAGLARTDCRIRFPACEARFKSGDLSWHAVIHEIAGLVLSLTLIAAPLVLARAFRGNESWRDLRAYSITTGVVAVLLMVMLYSGLVSAWSDALQRVFVTVLLLWIVTSGARLIRLSRLRPAVMLGANDSRDD